MPRSFFLAAGLCIADRSVLLFSDVSVLEPGAADAASFQLEFGPAEIVPKYHQILTVGSRREALLSFLLDGKRSHALDRRVPLVFW